MKKADLSNPPVLPDALPVLCTKCRTEGRMGEGDFAYLGELLNFTPVPRRPHVNGWDPDRQRGFIAALAVTGSPRRAAQSIGKHAFGAEQLKAARGGASFSAAWDAAMDIARERENAHFEMGLAGLAKQEQQRLAAFQDMTTPRPIDPDSEEGQVREASARIRQRFVNARRHYLHSIAHCPEKRAAWEVLVGPTDWDCARELRQQPGEPADDEIAAMIDPESGIHRASDADMVLAATKGMLAELTGGEDRIRPIRDLFAALAKPATRRSEEEEAAVRKHAATVEQAGWKQALDGSWARTAERR